MKKFTYLSVLAVFSMLSLSIFVSKAEAQVAPLQITVTNISINQATGYFQFSLTASGGTVYLSPDQNIALQPTNPPGTDTLVAYNGPSADVYVYPDGLVAYGIPNGATRVFSYQDFITADGVRHGIGKIYFGSTSTNLQQYSLDTSNLLEVTNPINPNVLVAGAASVPAQNIEKSGNQILGGFDFGVPGSQSVSVCAFTFGLNGVNINSIVNYGVFDTTKGIQIAGTFSNNTSDNVIAFFPNSYYNFPLGTTTLVVRGDTSSVAYGSQFYLSINPSSSWVRCSSSGPTGTAITNLPGIIDSSVMTVTPPSTIASALDASSPLASVVQISPTSATSNVPLAVFDLESQNASSTLQNLSLNINTIAGQKNLQASSLYGNMSIKVGDVTYPETSLTANSLSSSTVGFSSLNINLPANQFIPITVYDSISPQDTIYSGSEASISLVANNTNIVAVNTLGTDVPVSSNVITSAVTSFVAAPSSIGTSNNICVDDSGNNRIQEFTASGTYVTQWAGTEPGNGQSCPFGAGVSPSTGNTYVVDNQGIQELTPSGAIVTQWGSAGSGDGQFNTPTNVAVSPLTGNVYVADTLNYRIQEFTSSGIYVTQWGTPGSGNGQFITPFGIAVSPLTGNVYVVDQSNNRIEEFTASGTYVTQWNGSTGPANGQLYVPTDVVVLPSTGNVVVDDEQNNRIQEFTASGAYVTQWGSYGTGNGQFSYPCCISLSYSATPSTPPAPVQTFLLAITASTTSSQSVSITQGQSATLHWQGVNAINCIAATSTPPSKQWTGTLPSLEGSLTVTPSVTTTYTVSCYNADSAQLGYATVTVTPATNPTTTDTALITNAYVTLLNRQPDAQGLAYYLNFMLTYGWTITQVDNTIMHSAEYASLHTVAPTPVVTPASIAPVATSPVSISPVPPSPVTTAPTSTTPPSPVQTLFGVVSGSSSITAGQSVTLHWQGVNATTCTAAGANPPSSQWSGTLSATEASLTVTPSVTTTYTVSCYNANSAQLGSATVTVTPAASPSTSVSATTVTSTPTSTDTAAITNLYVTLLNRQPDAGGLAYYLNFMLNDGWTIQQVQSSIMQSAEYQNLHASSATSTTAAIWNALSAINSWLKQLIM